MSSAYRDLNVEHPVMQPESSGVQRMIQILLRSIAIMLIVFFLFSVIWVLFYKFTQPPSSFIMRRDRQQGIEIDRRPVSLDKISRHAILAVIAAEDQQFCTHKGFDWTAIARARSHNEDAPVVRGASTISMQTAKNAFLWPNRSWIRKGFEAYFTALIEILWSKQRIMEVYLNLAEWGKGVYGIESASIHYFGISSSQLNATQAALLAAALPTPTRSNPNQPTTYLSNRASMIEYDMMHIAREFGSCAGTRD